jgi:hypothetical protein
MNRRTFFQRVALTSGTALSIVPNHAGADAEVQVQNAIKNVYSVYFQERNKEKYQSLLTEDYILLENGELMDVRSDLAAMPGPESTLKRTDHFEFNSVKIQSDMSYAIFHLKSDISDQGKSRRGHWLESAILRKVGDRWLMCLLHSSRMPDHQKDLR